MDNDIRRLRVIPPRYALMKMDIGDIMDGISVSGLFMSLYRQFGKPFSSRNVYRYIVKYKDVVVDISSDGEKLNTKVYIAPYIKQIADKKRIKTINVIARDVNDRDKIFFPFEKMYKDLFFIVRRKNDVLYNRYVSKHGDSKESLDALRRESIEAIGENGMKRIYADDIVFVPEVKVIVGEIFSKLNG